MKKESLMEIKTSVIYVKKKSALAKNTVKLEIIVITRENFKKLHIIIAKLRYKIPKEILIVFHNVSTYDYNFIIKQLAIEFKGKFDCL